MAGLAVATVSVATAGVAHAEEVTPTPATEVTTVEIQAQPEVTQSQVTDAKATLDQAIQEVSAQEAVVKETQTAKNQAQLALGNATTAVSEAQELANQASPETIAQAKEAVTEATQNVTSAQKQLEETQATATTAQEAVASQETIVNNNQATVANAQKEVNDAKDAVEVAKQAIDKTSAQITLVDAQTELAEKTSQVSDAQTALNEAKTADATLVDKRKEAQEDLAQKELAKAETEKLLSQLAVDISKEQVSTSLRNHAYYNQRDAIWASYYGNGSFAATGCVPASLAMVFTELARREITPTQVADYLYQNTNHFNKTFLGTSAHGIVAATKHFGFVPTQLASQSAIIKALQAGHHVMGAVQNNKFSPWGPGYSHEVVMRGYSNGNTYIYDPYNRANIGWYPVANLWAEQSHDKDDRALGAPFFKITTQKMAALEAQKVKASSAVQTATRLASQALAQKETNLEEAQAELSLKETALSEAKEVLVASQAKWETLKASATEAEQAVTQAEQALEKAKHALAQQETRLAGLEEAPERLAKAKENLASAKADLATKQSAFEEAIAKLDDWKNKQFEAQTHYTTLLRTYQTSLAKDQQTQLLTDYQTIAQPGGQMVPVVDDTGKVTGYIDDKPSNDVRASTEGRSLASTATANRPLASHSDDALPETGEASSSIGMIGISLISLLGLVGLKRKA